MNGPDWDHNSDDDLLSLRIRDLGLKLEESDYFPLVQKVLQELKQNQLEFQPLIYLGDEWFSPEGEVAIAVPFYLVHPRLRALERKQMLECEGETQDEFARLFRHELGHAVDHAFQISKRSSFGKIFGSSKGEYDPETYRPRPYSRNYVQNIGRWYAQSHPDEDFAETFAVWLSPSSDWRSQYQNWGALKKLEYVDKLCKKFVGTKVGPAKGRMISDARFLNSTLRTYYQKKRRHFAEQYPDFYDRDLLRIFASSSDRELPKAREKASTFMSRNRKALVTTVAGWTGERKVTINGLVSRLILRCRDLDLIVVDSEARTMAETSAFLATLVSNYLFTGHFRRLV